MATKTTPEKATSLAQQPETGITSSWPDFGFPSLNRLRQEMDQMWNKFFDEVPALWNAEKTDLRWAFDIADNPDTYVVTAEAPGFEARDFNIQLRGDTLVLQAKKSKEEKSKEKQSFTSTEFYRAMSIPSHVAADKIEAAYDKGVLTVTLPKTEEGKGRTIEVKAPAAKS